MQISLFPEILSYIMILAQGASVTTDAAEEPDGGPVLDALQSPPLQPFEITISHINSRFRDIALSTARLWSYIYIDTSKHDARTVSEKTNTYLRRSGGHVLDLRVELNGPVIDKRCPSVATVNGTSQCMLHQAMEAIARESRRWKRLVIVAEYEGFANVGDALIAKLNGVCDGKDKGGGLVPQLEYLFVSVDFTNELRVAESGRGTSATPVPGVLAASHQQPHSQPHPLDGISDTTNKTPFTPAPFTCHLSKLSFLRLRGLAVCLFRPGSLPYLRTLHLDQTKAIPMDLRMLSRFAMACPALEHLSIYGDITTSSTSADGGAGAPYPAPGPGHAQSQQQYHSNWSMGSGGQQWLKGMNGSISSRIIYFPELRSLRVCGTQGLVYRVVLSRLEAPKLRSLVLKDVQEGDLEALWEEPFFASLFNGGVKMFLTKPESRFTQIQSLTISGSDLSKSAYQHLFKVFPQITEFASYSSMELDVALRLLAGDMINVPWPDLRALTFIFDADLTADDVKIVEMLSRRRKVGCPIHKLRIGVSELDMDDTVEENDSTVHDAVVVLEKLDEFDIWPSDRLYPDVDDILF